MSKKTKTSVEEKRNTSYQRTPVPGRPSSMGLKGAFKWNAKPRYPWGKAAGAAISIGIPFLAGALFHHMDWALLASIGAFTSLYVHNEPYPQRAIKLMSVNIGLVLSFGLGLVSSFSPYSSALVFAFVSACSMFLSGAFKIPPPAGYFFVLVCAVGTIVPHDLSQLPFRLGLAFLGGCVTWGICMSGWLTDPYRQEKSAVINVYRAIGDFLQSIGTASSDFQRHQLTLSLKNAEDAVLTSPFRKLKRKDKPLYYVHLIEKANDIFLSAIEAEAKSEKGLVKKLADTAYAISKAVGESENVSLEVLSGEKKKESLHTLEAELLEAGRILNEKSPFYSQRIAGPNRNIRAILRSAFDPSSVILPASLRIGLAVLTAAFIAIALGNERPYWVSLSCASVLQGATVLAVIHRSFQRFIGTAIGIIIGGFILYFHTEAWLLIPIMMLLQLIIELIIVRNYTLAVIFITPLALIITFFSHAGLPWNVLIKVRLLDTLLGTAVALAAGLLLWRRSSSSRLSRILSQTLQLSSNLFMDIVSEENKQKERSILLKERKRLLGLLLNLRAVYDGAMNEMRNNSEVMDSYWTAIVAVQRLAYLISAATVKSSYQPLDETTRKQIQQNFQMMILSIEKGTPLKSGTLPALTAYPGITEEMEELYESLKIIKKRMTI